MIDSKRWRKIARTKLTKLAKLVKLPNIAKTQVPNLYIQVAKLEVNSSSYTYFN